MSTCHVHIDISENLIKIGVISEPFFEKNHGL